MTVNKINRNEILEYLKIMEWNLIDMLSTPTIVRKKPMPITKVM